MTESIQLLSSMLSAKRDRIRDPTLEESTSLGSSAHVIVGSNDDLLSKILLCLPLKSLFRFKCVSKHWLSLITDPCFIRCRNLKPIPVSALYLQCRSPNMGLHYEFVPLDPSHKRAVLKFLTFVDHPHVEILQSCNGLFCCCSVEENEYLICNPTTKQSTTLPPLNGRDAMQLGAVNLAFDPSKSRFYKAVCIRHHPPYFDQYQIEVFSSETGSWIVSGAPFIASISIDFDSGVYWNGAIHWVSETGASLYFDLSEEHVLKMPMPPLPEHVDREIKYFGESGGHLHLVEFYSYSAEMCNYSVSEFKVYEMERDHSGWFAKFQFDLNEVVQSHPDTRESNNIYPFTILSVVRGAMEEDSFIVLHISDHVIQYNFRSKTSQVICYDFPITFVWPYAFQYMESLFDVREQCL